MKSKVIKEILDWVVCIVIAYVLYLIINYFFGTVSGVKQSSMYPTSKPGDKVIISRRVIKKKELKRGQIITLEAPIFGTGIEVKNGIALYPEYKGINNFAYHVMGIGKKSYIKRIIALEGEHLFISEDGKVYINDELLEEPYLSDDVNTIRSGNFYDLTIPEGCVFVMGDNREASADSRMFGAIPVDKVEGNVICRIWPLNKIGKIK